MATGQGLIEDSLLNIGVGAPGEELSDEILNRMERLLNRMWGGWAAEVEPVYTTTLTTHTWPASTETQTVSSSGSDITLAQPIDITGFQMRVDSVDYTLRRVSFRQYQTTGLKTTETNAPNVYAFVKGASEGTIYIQPLLSSSATARIQTIQPMTAFTLAGTVTLPDGYEEAIESNLAVLAAPQFGRAASPDLRRRAMHSKRVIEIMNDESGEMSPDSRIPGAVVADDLDALTN